MGLQVICNIMKAIPRDIPRAATQKNVNYVVYKSIVSKLERAVLENGVGGPLLVDAPCGAGEFASYLKEKFPALQVKGVDLLTEAAGQNFEFYKLGTHDFFKQQPPESVDVITCISGIMCFDGISELLASFYAALRPAGLLIVTNDNIMTLRDRLNFLFFGHFKRFKLLYAVNEGNWNVVLPQAVVSLLQKNNFKNIRLQFTAVYVEDLFLLPLAILIYPVFVLYLVSRKNHMSITQRLAIFPFLSLISRHYVVTAEKS